MFTAKDIMTRKVITVTPDMPVEEFADILWTYKISGVPVVENGTVISVVTENDLIDQKKKVHIPTVLTILDSFVYLEKPSRIENEIKKMAGIVVRDICSPKAVTITEDTPLDEIATIMAEKKVHTLPVIKDGELVGVVGKSDIIKTLIRG